MKTVNWAEIIELRADLASEGLTIEEEQQLRRLLLKMKIGGRMSSALFFWTRAHLVSPAIEVVFYRKVDDHNEVLLKRRPNKKDDPYYGGKLGVIGRVEMPGHGLPYSGPADVNVSSVRLVLRDALAEIGLKEDDLPTAPRNVDFRLFPGDRSWVHQTVCVWEVPVEMIIKEAEWYSVDNLPPDIIEEHISLIKLAAKYF